MGKGRHQATENKRKAQEIWGQSHVEPNPNVWVVSRKGGTRGLKKEKNWEEKVFNTSGESDREVPTKSR